MAEAPKATYTAKLTDGPLEGTTLATEFLESGVARPQLEIAAATNDKRYVYSRSSEVEYGSAGGASSRPTAVAYRYTETLFD